MNENIFFNDEKKIMQNNSEVEFFINCASVTNLKTKQNLKEGKKIKFK